MTNSQKFQKAHKVARQTVSEVGNYQIAFKLALVELNQPKQKIDLKDTAFLWIGIVCMVALVISGGSLLALICGVIGTVSGSFAGWAVAGVLFVSSLFVGGSLLLDELKEIKENGLVSYQWNV
ncbi:TMhelix containing protein [Vibrio phage 1.170.O._10N.261.52.C3]|nr:TMhelix containing protein [Vibrio phage 1.170.O._10N.261.52.C3]